MIVVILYCCDLFVFFGFPFRFLLDSMLPDEPTANNVLLRLHAAIQSCPHVQFWRRCASVVAFGSVYADNIAVVY